MNDEVDIGLSFALLVGGHDGVDSGILELCLLDEQTVGRRRHVRLDADPVARRQLSAVPHPGHTHQRVKQLDCHQRRATL